MSNRFRKRRRPLDEVLARKWRRAFCPVCGAAYRTVEVAPRCPKCGAALVDLKGG